MEAVSPSATSSTPGSPTASWSGTSSSSTSVRSSPVVPPGRRSTASPSSPAPSESGAATWSWRSAATRRATWERIWISRCESTGTCARAVTTTGWCTPRPQSCGPKCPHAQDPAPPADPLASGPDDRRPRLPLELLQPAPRHDRNGHVAVDGLVRVPRPDRGVRRVAGDPRRGPQWRPVALLGCRLLRAGGPGRCDDVPRGLAPGRALRLLQRPSGDAQAVDHRLRREPRRASDDRVVAYPGVVRRPHDPTVG